MARSLLRPDSRRIVRRVVLVSGVGRRHRRVRRRRRRRAWALRAEGQRRAEIRRGVELLHRLLLGFSRRLVVVVVVVAPMRPLRLRRLVLVLDPVPAVVAARRAMAVLVRVPSVSSSAVAGFVFVLPAAVLLAALGGLVEQVADGDELEAAEEDHLCGCGLEFGCVVRLTFDSSYCLVKSSEDLNEGAEVAGDQAALAGMLQVGGWNGYGVYSEVSKCLKFSGRQGR
jgi:hypothetical protein